MTVLQYTIWIVQGATWENLLQLVDKAGVPVNLAGKGLRGKIRDAKDYSVLATLSVTSRDDAKGIISLSLSAAETAAMPLKKVFVNQWSKELFDVELFETRDGVSTVQIVVNGIANIRRGVTMGVSQ